MSYHWVAEPVAHDVEATELTRAGIDERFADQATAEAWLGANYLELADLGIAQVSLYEEDRLVYGLMPLDE